MGEEDFLITKPVSTPYVEATEEALECSFRSFEIAHATMMEATVDEVIKPHKSKVEVMTTRIMGGGGYSLNQNLETLLKIPSNDGRFGLGYKPSIYDKIRLQEEKKKKRLTKLEMREFDPSIKLIPELYDIFKSAGISYSSHNSDLKDDLLTKMESLSVAAVAQEASFEGNTVYAYNIHKNEDVSDSSSTLDALIYTMESDKESDFEDDVGISSKLLRMVEEEDEVLGSHQELVEAINLGSQEKSKEDMPGLSTDIVVHRVPLKSECNLVRQKLRKMKPDVLIKIKEEVQKKIEAGFLTVSKYPEWVENIVPVFKKDEKVRMCVDNRDLNRASPKDNFSLPHIDMLVDNTAGYSTFSFMDGFSGYNQIKMAEEAREKTTFITLWGTFCYKVIPFGLKNDGATYQRAMVTLFHDMMHKEIEVYVDDTIAKSKADEDHTTTL
ncbi:protein NYNRIN-like [Cucumis melo var. makuwa]|uniref:Protein NYNRIN-like n=1 Tax=Cucumis melo var. makuwa TaxID=1194695 RepID=A0A5D3DA63_CUCMM|nr:protein NYNRIN-like [Cucumis melo var. makuwa]